MKMAFLWGNTDILEIEIQLTNTKIFPAPLFEMQIRNALEKRMGICSSNFPTEKK